jgi:2-hydroxychromene-2-carboxylate isomerase
MSSKSIHFYFDYISPFAYFAWRQLPAIAKKCNRQIEAHPVVFGKLLDHWGQLGPAEIEPKRNWLHQFCLRYAVVNGFEYNPPKYHPFNPLAALRMSLKEVSGDDQHRVISTIFESGWSRGEDLGDMPTLIALLSEQSIDGEHFGKAAVKPDVKKLLVDETALAIEKGVFGVPSIIIDDKLFWGNDQMEHIELVLAGKDPLGPDKLRVLERPRAIDRKVFTELDIDH